MGLLIHMSVTVLLISQNVYCVGLLRIVEGICDPTKCSLLIKLSYQAPIRHHSNILQLTQNLIFTTCSGLYGYIFSERKIQTDDFEAKKMEDPLK